MGFLDLHLVIFVLMSPLRLSRIITTCHDVTRTSGCGEHWDPRAFWRFNKYEYLRVLERKLFSVVISVTALAENVKHALVIETAWIIFRTCNQQKYWEIFKLKRFAFFFLIFLSNTILCVTKLLGFHVISIPPLTILTIFSCGETGVIVRNDLTRF